MEADEHAQKKPIQMPLPSLRPRVDKAHRSEARKVPELQTAQMGHRSKKNPHPFNKELKRAGKREWVYLMATTDLKLAKIGYTKSPFGRYVNMNACTNKTLGQGMRFLALMPGTRKTEKMLHEKWRLALVNGNEWFMPAPGMLDDFRETCVDLSTIADGFCGKHGVYNCACSNWNGNDYYAESERPNV